MSETRNQSGFQFVPPAHDNAVRAAACEFVRGTTTGWSRRDLADWLVTHYAPVTGAVRARSSEGPARSLDDVRLEEIVRNARAHTLTLLGNLSFPSLGSPVARGVVAAGHVAISRDERGAGAYVPISLPRMRLDERVASLFVADWLNDPTDYRRVRLCRSCGEIAFGVALPHADYCIMQASA